MAKLIYGERIGQAAKLMVGTAAIIFDVARERVLLTRRADNGRWCLPGGQLEPGESAEEGCVREVWEETGLQVAIRRLVGIYTSPHRITEYRDGSRHQIVAFGFEAEVVGGELGLSNETTAYGYFSQAEMGQIDVMEHHLERIADALSNQCAAFVR
jgi:8-oxo-dGTP pyrophosphatase MutT (NUDIX family)